MIGRVCKRSNPCQLTGPNRSIGLTLSSVDAAHQKRGLASVAAAHDKRGAASVPAFRIQTRIRCGATTWWLWRGVYTRSHPELGRENPQRRWYFVLRRGRVGRRQVFPPQRIQPTRPRTSSSSRRPRAHRDRRHNAGWSSPVARQAHNLKVRGSNPLPATNLRNQSQISNRHRPLRGRLVVGPLTRASRTVGPDHNRKVRGSNPLPATSFQVHELIRR